MSKHTPAPWAVVTELRPQDEIVADMVNKMWVIPAEHQSLGDNYADACLIAAAPDLLQALKIISVWAKNGRGEKDFGDIAKLANETIEKAKEAGL